MMKIFFIHFFNFFENLLCGRGSFQSVIKKYHLRRNKVTEHFHHAAKQLFYSDSHYTTIAYRMYAPNQTLSNTYLILESPYTKRIFDSKFNNVGMVNSHIVQHIFGFMKFLDIFSSDSNFLDENYSRYIIDHNHNEMIIEQVSFSVYNVKSKKIEVIKNSFSLIYKDDRLFIADIDLINITKFGSEHLFSHSNSKYRTEDPQHIVDFYTKNELRFIPVTNGIFRFIEEKILTQTFPLWQETGFPETKDDVEVLKMIAY